MFWIIFIAYNEYISHSFIFVSGTHLFKELPEVFDFICDALQLGFNIYFLQVNIIQVLPEEKSRQQDSPLDTCHIP